MFSVRLGCSHTVEILGEGGDVSLGRLAYSSFLKFGISKSFPFSI